MSSTRRLMIAVSMAGLLGLLFLPVQATASHVHCGDAITQDTTFDSDVLGCSSPLTVTGDVVTLNLNGHSLEGGISMRISDSVFRTSLVIENGTVRNGTVAAASVRRATIRNLHADGIRGRIVDDLLIEGNEVSGESGECGIGAGLWDTSARILNNEVRGCPSVGVSISGLGGTSGTLEGNVIERNGVGAGFGLRHQGVTLRGNTIRRNTGDGVTLGSSGAGLTATGNRIADNGGNGIVTHDDENVVLRTEHNVISGNAENGIGVYPSENMVFRSTYDVISHNGLAGIEATPPEGFFTLLGAAVSGNGTDGIHVEEVLGGDITDTRADRNSDDGLDIDSGRIEDAITFTRNHTWFNGDLGIEAVPGVIDGGGNWAKHNGNPLQCLNISCSTKGKPK